MINYCGDNTKIKNAILVLNQEGFLNSLIEELINAPTLTHTELSGADVAQEIAHTFKRRTICVEIYYPRWKWSKAMGYFSASKPNTIHINGYKLKNMSIETISGLILHELTHLASNESINKFDHGNNNPKGKEFSAPFFIGRTTKLLISKRVRV